MGYRPLHCKRASQRHFKTIKSLYFNALNL